MIKYYCDLCGDEINDSNKAPVEFICKISSRNNPGLPKTGVTFCLSEVDTNKKVDLHYCKYCMIEAVNMMDDRPKRVAD